MEMTKKDKITVTVLLSLMSLAAIILFFLVPKHIPYEYDLAVLCFWGAVLFFGIALAAKLREQPVIKTASLNVGYGFVFFYIFMSSEYGSLILLLYAFFPLVLSCVQFFRKPRKMFDHVKEN